MPFQLDMTRAQKVSGIVRTSEEMAGLGHSQVRVGRETASASGVVSHGRARSAQVFSKGAHLTTAATASSGSPASRLHLTRLTRNRTRASVISDGRPSVSASGVPIAYGSERTVRSSSASPLHGVQAYAVDALVDEASSSDELQGLAETRSVVRTGQRAVRTGRKAVRSLGGAKSAFERGVRAASALPGSQGAASTAASVGGTAAGGGGAATAAGSVASGAGASAGGGAAAAAGGLILPVLLMLAALVALMLLIAAIDGGEDDEIAGLSENESIVANLLRDYGFDDLHVAAIMGNWARESDNNPRQVQHGFGYCVDADGNGVDDCAEQDDYPPELVGNPNAGYGLAQWTYPSRCRALVDFAAASAAHSGQADVQVAFFYLEFSGSIDRFNAIDDLEAATRWFHEVYEISADAEEGMMLRVGAAERIYAALTHSGAGYVAAAKAMADDDTHGYSLERRTRNPDVDCSSFVYYSLLDSGFDASEIGGYPFSTFTMGPILESVGFERLPFTGMGDLIEGDILVNPSRHTEIYYGDGQCLGAHSDYDRVPGDSSGREVCLGSFWDAGYTDVYRRAA